MTKQPAPTDEAFAGLFAGTELEHTARSENEVGSAAAALIWLLVIITLVVSPAIVIATWRALL